MQFWRLHLPWRMPCCVFNDSVQPTCYCCWAFCCRWCFWFSIWKRSACLDTSPITDIALLRGKQGFLTPLLQFVGITGFHVKGKRRFPASQFVSEPVVVVRSVVAHAEVCQGLFSSALEAEDSAWPIVRVDIPVGAGVQPPVVAAVSLAVGEEVQCFVASQMIFFHGGFGAP